MPPPMKFMVEGLTPELVKKAEVELGETEQNRTQCLKELRRLINEEPDFFPCTEDFFLLRFLRAKKFKTDKAFATLKNFYEYKARYSRILTDFEVSELSEIMEQDKATNFEYRDSAHGGIGYIRLGDIDIEKTTPDQVFACVLMLGELAIGIEATQVAGYSGIIDFAGFNLRMMKHYSSPALIYRIVSGIQDVTPCRIRGYHFVNEPFYFNIVFSIIKTFLSPKLASRLHLHGSNLKSLHKHFSPDILPEELGGKQGPMKNFLKVYKDKIYSMADHFKKLNKFGYQGETLRKLRGDIDDDKKT